MSHARQQIRDAVVTTVTGLALTASRVHSGRVYPIDRLRLPALSVFSLQESVQDEGGQTGLKQIRELTIAIEVMVEKTSSLDDEIDSVCEQVEVALHADTTLGGLTKWIEYTGVDISLEDGGEKPIGTAQMTFVALYSVDAQAPGTIIA